MFDDNFFDLILDGPFTWDKNAYKFNRTEKDMHPYSVVDGKETLVIVHNVLGVDKKDLKLTIKNENGKIKHNNKTLNNFFIWTPFITLIINQIRIKIKKFNIVITRCFLPHTSGIFLYL